MPEEPRAITMTHDGRQLVLRRPDGKTLEIVDARRTSSRVALAVEGVDDFTCVGERILVARPGGVSLFGLDGAPLATREVADMGPGGWRVCDGPGAATAIWAGSVARLFDWNDGTIEVHELGALATAAFVASLGGLRLLVVRGRQAEIHDLRRGRLAGWKLLGEGTVTAAASALGGRSLVLLSSGEQGSSLEVVMVRVARVNRVELPRVLRFACAEQRGIAVAVLERNRLVAIELLHGTFLSEVNAPFPVLALAIDSDGRHLTLAGADALLHVSYTDLFGVRAPPPARRAAGAERDGDEVEAVEKEEAPVAPPAPRPVVVPEPVRPAPVARPVPERRPEPARPAPVARPVPERRPVPVRPARAVVERPRAEREAVASPPPEEEVAGRAEPGRSAFTSYAAPVEHFAHLLDAVAARAAAAIADAWERGARRIEDGAEIVALAGIPRGPHEGSPQGLRAAAEARLRELTGEIEQRMDRPPAGGLPLVAIVRAFGLSPLAAEILVAVAAPAARGEIARLYGLLSGGEPRERSDRHLVGTLLGRRDARLRARVAEELAEDGRLIATGLIDAEPGLFAPLSIDGALLRRLRGGAATPARAAEEIDDTGRELLAHLDGPARVVLRETAGVGAGAWLRGIAGRRGMAVADLDGERASAGELRRALARAALGRALPCLRGLAWRAPGDEPALQAVLRDHPGPIVFLAPAAARLPLEAGFASLAVPELGDAERHRLWQEALGNDVDVESASARHPLGRGLLAALAGVAQGEDDVDAAVRRIVAAGLPVGAVLVESLPTWDELALPEATLDGLREIAGRARSGGVTALLHGRPGTGKASAAGLVARELGRDLYRLDVADLGGLPAGVAEREVCRAIDGAADGGAVLLLGHVDERLVAGHAVRRRLAAAAGVVVMTCETPPAAPAGTIRLALPFPDEELRARLWRLHAPLGLADDEVAGLARAALSGGAIRRSVGRAAVLAAEEAAPLGLDQLERAVRVEATDSAR